MFHSIIMPLARYDAEARADAVSRGLAVRTVGSYDAFRLTLSVEGSFDDVEKWLNDHDGSLLAEPNEPNPKPNMEPNEAARAEAARADVDQAEAFYRAAAAGPNETSAWIQAYLARQDILVALSLAESDPAEAMLAAERARKLVGVSGIRDIGHALAETDPARGWYLLGSLDALLAEGTHGCPGEAHRASWHDGYDNVSYNGLEGAWLSEG
jgi:hypothetical protein